MKPQEFSPLALYGNREVFRKRLEEGYERVRLGSGDWIDGTKISALWAFYHPDGRISTYQHTKEEDLMGTASRAEPVEMTFAPENFELYLKENRVRMGNGKSNLKKIVESLEE